MFAVTTVPEQMHAHKYYTYQNPDPIFDYPAHIPHRVESTVIYPSYYQSVHLKYKKFDVTTYVLVTGQTSSAISAAY